MNRHIGGPPNLSRTFMDTTISAINVSTIPVPGETFPVTKTTVSNDDISPSDGQFIRNVVTDTVLALITAVTAKAKSFTAVTGCYMHEGESNMINSIKQTRCKNCSGCQTANCASCWACLDMPQFGGKNLKRQACVRRNCLNLTSSKNKTSLEMSRVSVTTPPASLGSGVATLPPSMNRLTSFEQMKSPWRCKLLASPPT